MEEETAQIREDAKKTIEMNLKKHQEQLHTEVLRYKKLLDEQAQEERKEMENKMNDVAIKAAMASQNEMTARNKLTIAQEVIAAQNEIQKQVAEDHLFSTELQRKEKVEEEIREAKRIDKQRVILDRQIKEEEARKREYIKLKTKNKLKKIIETTEKEAEAGDNHHILSPVKFPSSFKPGSPLQNMDEILGIKKEDSNSSQTSSIPGVPVSHHK